ncbi:MAG: glycosyltransferase family 4 protein [Polyangiaceae bacterium]
MMGAREHYGLPRLLQRLGRLGELVTDVWNPLGRRGESLGAQLPLSLRRFLQRHHDDIPNDIVASIPSTLLLDPRFNPLRQRLGITRLHTAQARWFAKRVAGRDELHGGCITFCAAAQEILERYRAAGKTAILDAYDPGEPAARIVARERERRPNWECGARHDHEPLWDRRRHEYALADAIIVNSRWTEKCLIDTGVPAEKLHVVPLFYEGATGIVGAPFNPRHAPLRVLWVGHVSLHKGIAYLLEAVSRMPHGACEIDIVGGVSIAPEIVAKVGDNVHFHGLVSRDEVARFYRQADVFILPTLSDGFAITQLEAHAHGVPVIVTPRAGDVVVPNETGLIVEPESVEAIEAALSWCIDHREALASMRSACAARVADFSLAAVAKRLDSVLSEIETGF